MTTKKNEIVIYTDGACDPNPGRGGWGAILVQDGKERILKGKEAVSTNNRMELTAALQALKVVPSTVPVTIFTDSQYLKKGIEEWLPNWIARGWRRKGGVLANVDLWQDLAKEINTHSITWKWVRGHNGNIYNERVDKIARNAIKGK
ncbi:MAG TPA: ribonuclease HI [Anaerolineaceae bacterium]|uniref:Ribonuclease H n=1 Tax=Anaerolinea thermophila TaxID=167964 RepID=A0A101FY35_9CHLR|nr:MAG: Ribonuclease H [Anaerolinea thermophila]HAF61647.1 ribonuclease HI [Anaerolineaceae bacterium]